jgi:hypothetical protein
MGCWTKRPLFQPDSGGTTSSSIESDSARLPARARRKAPSRQDHMRPLRSTIRSWSLSRNAELVGNAPAASLRRADHLVELIQLCLLGGRLALRLDSGHAELGLSMCQVRMPSPTAGHVPRGLARCLRGAPRARDATGAGTSRTRANLAPQTGWFVESLLTQTLLIHIIHTNAVPSCKAFGVDAPAQGTGSPRPGALRNVIGRDDASRHITQPGRVLLESVDFGAGCPGVAAPLERDAVWRRATSVIPCGSDDERRHLELPSDGRARR